MGPSCVGFIGASETEPGALGTEGLALRAVRGGGAVICIVAVNHPTAADGPSLHQ